MLHFITPSFLYMAVYEFAIVQSSAAGQQQVPFFISHQIQWMGETSSTGMHLLAKNCFTMVAL
jgi:hypothetical protein